MKKRSIEEISNACGGEIRNCDLKQNVSIFVNNDKEIVENCVYVAIKGEKYDGFDFAQSAISKGACAVLCDKNTCSDLPCIAVDNVLDALQDIARYFREKELKNVVAVTGSYGKTTVKELCASVLGQKSQVLKTKGNT